MLQGSHHSGSAVKLLGIPPHTGLKVSESVGEEGLSVFAASPRPVGV